MGYQCPAGYLPQVPGSPARPGAPLEGEGGTSCCQSHEMVPWGLPPGESGHGDLAMANETALSGGCHAELYICSRHMVHANTQVCMGWQIQRSCGGSSAAHIGATDCHYSHNWCAAHHSLQRYGASHQFTPH